jgi:hypothetical protein
MLVLQVVIGRWRVVLRSIMSQFSSLLAQCLSRFGQGSANSSLHEMVISHRCHRRCTDFSASAALVLRKLGRDLLRTDSCKPTNVPPIHTVSPDPRQRPHHHPASCMGLSRAELNKALVQRLLTWLSLTGSGPTERCTVHKTAALELQWRFCSAMDH